MEAIDLLTDFVGRPQIDAEELDRERGVVIQEIQRYKDQPSAVAEELIDRAAFGDHPLGPHRARPRGAPAHVHARGDRRLPRAPLGGRARRRVRRRQPRARRRRTARVDELFGRFPTLPAPERLRARPAARSRARSSSERDTNQSHLRMIYRPDVDVTDPRPARRADDLLDAAGRLDGLAPVRRDPRAARPLLLGLRRSTTRSPTSPILQLGAGLESAKCVEAYTRMREIVAELHADGPDRGGGRARARLRRRPPRPGLREHQRGRALRRQRRRSSSARTSTPTRDRALDAVTFDEVAAVARGGRPRRSWRSPASGPHEAERVRAGRTTVAHARSARARARENRRGDDSVTAVEA